MGLMTALTSRPVAVKLHIDHLANPKRDVWAVQFAGRYLTAQRVEVRVPMATVFRGVSARQPRAYLVGRGIVSRSTDGRTLVIGCGR